VSNGAALTLVCILLGCSDGSGESPLDPSKPVPIDGRVASGADEMEAGTPFGNARFAPDTGTSHEGKAGAPGMDASSNRPACILPRSASEREDWDASSDLSCEQRVTKQASLVNEAISANQACERDSDCVDLSNSTGCNFGCGRIVSASCKEAVVTFIDQVDRELCSTFADDCYVPDLPPCPPPPPDGVSCTNGTCRLF
jgi:hypothetical protein